MLKTIDKCLIILYYMYKQLLLFIFTLNRFEAYFYYFIKVVETVEKYGYILFYGFLFV